METATLKIKFKPLFQKKTVNNSKCCLEIVPEISCLQNLDKLIWRQEANFIEYSIPMTYKVILQKRQGVKKYSDTSVKTYHSCVDLLQASSNSVVNFRSGDVIKIISDTFICKKCENCMSKEYFKNSLANKPSCFDNDLIVCNVSQETTNTRQLQRQLEMMGMTGNISNNPDDKVKNKTKKFNKFGNVRRVDVSLSTLTNTEDRIFGDTIHNENREMQTLSAIKANKQESTRWLSLSPIYSLTACKSPSIKNVASKGITCKIYDSQRDLVLLRSISTPSDFSYDNQAQNNRLTTFFNLNRQKPPKFTLLCRNPPEIRVVECMRFIENEILPLNMWLNDIIRECTALGVIGKPTTKQNLAITTTTTSSGPEMHMAEENTKSNRVVYSIVFDG